MQASELPEVAYTRGWVAKEVVAKAAGTGLGGHLRDYIVTARDGDCLLINDRWVVTHHLHDHVLGWSLDSQLSFLKKSLNQPHTNFFNNILIIGKSKR